MGITKHVIFNNKKHLSFSDLHTRSDASFPAGNAQSGIGKTKFNPDCSVHSLEIADHVSRPLALLHAFSKCKSPPYSSDRRPHSDEVLDVLSTCFVGRCSDSDIRRTSSLTKAAACPALAGSGDFRRSIQLMHPSPFGISSTLRFFYE